MMYHFISVVVPAYNAESFIGGCIESLLALDYPNDKIEILIVDNNSSDGSPAIISQYPVIALTEKKQGACAARNKGALYAKGDIFASTDADCLIHANWAKEINQTFQDPKVAAVMGFAGGINENFWAWLEQENFEEFWYRKDSGSLSLKRRGIDTRNCAIKKTVLEACGYFNENILNCGDLDLSVRLNRGSYFITLNEQMKVRHYNRTNVPTILNIKECHARAILQIVEQQPVGWDCQDLPGNTGSFFRTMDNSFMSGIQLRGTLLGMKLLSTLLLVGLKGLSLIMTRPNVFAVKMFKTLCGATWQVVFLQAKKQHLGNDQTRTLS